MKRWYSLDAARASVCAAIVLLATAAFAAAPQSELRFCLPSEPKTLHPLLVSDESSEIVRYLTGGVLIRLNRTTQELMPELAASWQLAPDGRGIRFKLRQGVSFSDGTPFSAEDVAYTFRTLMDPTLHSPMADSFRSGSGAPEFIVNSPDQVTLIFPAIVAGLDRLFDQVSILSSRSPRKEMAALGPYYIAEHKAGSQILLKQNPYYWKRDSAGKRLPYMTAVRLYVRQNREIEMLRFLRGELDLMNNLAPDAYDQLAQKSPAAVRDLGPSLDSEMMWFNQVPQSPVPEYKKAWFRSRNFRRAISAATNRADLCRVVYHGHAQPAAGPVSPANRFWFNTRLKPPAFDRAAALVLLRQDGFRLANGELRDGDGRAVEFSVITNAGNRPRERMAAMMQQDLLAIGIRLNPVTLDFASLIERITRTYDYEACLLGFTNVDLDPSAEMSVWLSSSGNHPWNPNQKTAATGWEAEIDRLMRAQASATSREERKAAFDKVQEIVSAEAPLLYLVNRNSLVAVSPVLQHVRPSVLSPQTYWNVEYLETAPQAAGRRP